MTVEIISGDYTLWISSSDSIREDKIKEHWTLSWLETINLKLGRLDGYKIVFFDSLREVHNYIIEADEESLFLLDDFVGELYSKLAKKQPPLSMMGPAVFYDIFMDKENEFSFHPRKVIFTELLERLDLDYLQSKLLIR